MVTITDLILKKVFDSAFEKVKDIAINKDIKVLINKEDIVSAMDFHLKYVLTKSEIISFKDISTPKELSQQYISLNILENARKQLPLSFERKKIDLSEIVETKGHSIILGDPGAGKSTSLKFIAQKAILGDIQNYNFPILIHLRELNEDESLFNRLQSILGLTLTITSKHKDFDNNSFPSSFPENSPHIKQLYYRILITYLDSLGCLVLIDGLDELSEKKFKETLEELKVLVENLHSSKIVFTCRSGAYNFYIEGCTSFEIQSLKESQIIEFAARWFGNQNDTLNFIKQLSEISFRDNASRPLALAQLCTLYDKYKKLPEKPKLIYKRLLKLYLEEWDSERGIYRDGSDYSKLEVERKIEFLETFAFELINLSESLVYTNSIFAKAYEKICHKFNLPIKDVEKAVSEIETHNGIVIQSSSDSFEFINKSTQEYLTASHIVRMSKIPYDLISVKKLHNELAIAVSLSSTPNEYFISTVFDYYAKNNENTLAFISRIALEKPDFQISTLLAYSLYYCISLISKSHDVIGIIQRLNSNPSVRSSFGLYNTFCDRVEVEDREGSIQISTSKIFDMDRIDDKEYWMEYTIANIPSSVIIPETIMKNIS